MPVQKYQVNLLEGENRTARAYRSVNQQWVETAWGLIIKERDHLAGWVTNSIIINLAIKYQKV